jgi:hypothetical protein
MPRGKRHIERTVTIQGFPLVWRLHREQHYAYGEGWTGPAIHVQVAQGVKRDLFLEYPAVQNQQTGRLGVDHIEVNIRPAKVEAHIEQAIEAGWNPESRGKPFVFEVEELPF